MPVIIFEGPKLSREQKSELVEKFTEIASNVTGIGREAFVVLIKENEPDNVGVGGKLLSELKK
ncbi:4-oxalocrotonate tautomerase family enzyme [Ferroglobus placidus DSM 10642]|uniref:4-oxalocrotonate tautomerase family enzyme n=1 Tax=Ferroglobus placidus (strain DSM 10642 / AEDII12DO) TaxID=589924 RepID=D3RXF0_FERPA|nr:4-oxalocrotonate tautomerase DmpI [Ferroglobus placidus]ADC65163.1 4-oxalocrotonate tautomerase family enzyme [Ferroglobus placidus DSM 10642]